MGNQLNMMIARTHQLSGRLVGMQITAGTFIGVLLSAVQMSAGFFVLNQAVIAGNWLIGVAMIVVGILLAVMIERLSLAGLSGVRVAEEGRKLLETEFYQLEQPTEQQQTFFSERKEAFKRSKKAGWVFGAGGMIISAGVGDVFWDHMFSPLNPWIGVPMSLACAAVIALNFIHAELFKSLMDMVLKSIMIDHSVEKTAVAAAGQDMQVNVMIDAYASVQNDESVQGPVKEKIKGVIGRRLTGFAREVSIQTEQMSTLEPNVVEGSLIGPGRQLALPAPRGKYGQHRDELLRLLRANPQLSQRDIAAHFNVSRSTANEWNKKLRAGL